jgi:glycosyltransferase involved in cell wall biosynthesis
MKKIAISGINLFEGGTLSVLKDCLQSIETSNQFDDCEFIALVHKKSLFDVNAYKRIVFVEFPKSRKSYLYRFYYEYVYFKKFAKRSKIDFWFSIHDMSPNVGNIPQVVYCHNPSPFKKTNFKDLFIQPTVFLFTLFYSYIYQINIKKNKYVVVQQLWIKNEFYKRFGVHYDKIIIAKPQEPKINIETKQFKESNNLKSFVFPTFPRSFKNIEVIGEAVKILNNEGFKDFLVSVTIDGTENKYSHMMYNRYGNFQHLNFIGLQTREAVYDLYSQSDCLIFPSTLETWGLPVSEYKQFDKPMIVADLPYAKETVGMYDKAVFFNPHDASALANSMKEVILSKTLSFSKTEKIIYPKPYVENWEKLWVLMIYS